jgi:hypothetical protein
VLARVMVVWECFNRPGPKGKDYHDPTKSLSGEGSAPVATRRYGEDSRPDTLLSVRTRLHHAPPLSGGLRRFPAFLA